MENKTNVPNHQPVPRMQYVSLARRPTQNYRMRCPFNIWLVVDLPLWKMMDFVSWDDDIPKKKWEKMWSKHFHFCGVFFCTTINIRSSISPTKLSIIKWQTVWKCSTQNSTASSAWEPISKCWNWGIQTMFKHPLSYSWFYLHMYIYLCITTILVNFYLQWLNPFLMVDFYQQHSARMSYQVGCIPYCLTLVTPLSIIVPHSLLFKFPFKHGHTIHIMSSWSNCILRKRLFSVAEKPHFLFADEGSVPHQVFFLPSNKSPNIAKHSHKKTTFFVSLNPPVNR